jgi:DNA-directed RNA polymerase specialized sigma24 family protein
MNTQELVSYLDELLFSYTGERIDSLQVAILKGVLKGQKYADIAQEFNCSAGHAKDEAYKLWQTLSDALGEEITKSNFRARIEKITAKNSKIFRNTIQIGKFNLCSNSSPDIEENDDVIREDQIIFESAQKKIKRETIPRLVKLGLTAEQIAEALDLPLQEVKKILAIPN